MPKYYSDTDDIYFVIRDPRDAKPPQFNVCPTVSYNKLEMAEQEARRLSSLHPEVRFHVVRATSTYHTETRSVRTFHGPEDKPGLEYDPFY